MNRLFIVLFGLVVASCGSNSSDNSTNPTAVHEEKVKNLDYNTLAGLQAEDPCIAKLNGVVAHIKEENAEYVCFCDKGGACNWVSLQTEMPELLSSSSSLRDAILTSSSSSFKMIEVSSSGGIKSFSELAGMSCAIELYKDSDELMSYMVQALVFPIEGTSNSVKCLKNENDEWIWTIVENESLNKSSSSNSFKFGTFTDPRDGQVYKTIGIKYSDDVEMKGGEEEVWFAEDLRYCPQCERSSDTLMRYSWSDAMKSGCVVGKSCTIQNDIQGLCPTGWLILPMGDLVIRIGNEVVGEKLVEKGADYWDTKIEIERLTDGFCKDQCNIYDCVPYYDPEIFTTMYYTEVDKYGLGFSLKSVYAGECTSASEVTFKFTKHRLRCYKKGKVPSSQTTVGICWSRYDGYTTQNICDMEKKIGL